MALTPARVVARLLANVEQAGGCVVTLYSVGSHGYGQSSSKVDILDSLEMANLMLGAAARTHALCRLLLGEPS